jgi:hypothetical protein
MDAGIDFVACDNPYANKLTLHILAAIAEHEKGDDQPADKGGLNCGQGKGSKTWWLSRYGVHRRNPPAGCRNETEKRGYAARVSPVIQEILDAGHTV